MKGVGRMNPEERKNQILEIAKKVFAERGYYKTNIEMICNQAGVSRGTIYRYFKNKEEIFAVILEERFKGALRGMVQEYESREFVFKNREEIVADYVRSIEESLAFTVADRDFARIALEVSTGVSKRFTQMRQDYERKFLAQVQKILDQWKRNDFVRDDLDTELAAIRLIGAMEKIARMFLFDPTEGRELDGEQIRILARKNAELDLYGFLVPESKPPGDG
jgi:AcrR family transcriptional regulator